MTTQQSSGAVRTNRPKVYIAGPISKGDLRHNIAQARSAAKRLIDAGYAVLCPHLSCYFDGDTPSASAGSLLPETWYEVDLPWVAAADAVLRLPGVSRGADLEVEHAKLHSVPVFTTVESLIGAVKAHLPQPGKFPPILHPSSQRYESILEDMRQLHRRKAADYGTVADPFRNIRASAEVGIEPWRGCWLRAKDKVKRIDTYCQTGKLANEGVEDSLMDLAAYAMIGLVLFREAQEATENQAQAS